MRIQALATLAIAVFISMTANAAATRMPKIISYKSLVSMSPAKRVEYLNGLRAALAEFEESAAAEDKVAAFELRQFLDQVASQIALLPQAHAADESEVPKLGGELLTVPPDLQKAAPAVRAKGSRPIAGDTTFDHWDFGRVPRFTKGSWKCLNEDVSFNSAVGTCVYEGVSADRCGEKGQAVRIQGSADSFCVPYESFSAIPSAARREELANSLSTPAAVATPTTASAQSMALDMFSRNKIVNEKVHSAVKAKAQEEVTKSYQPVKDGNGYKCTQKGYIFNSTIGTCIYPITEPGQCTPEKGQLHTSNVRDGKEGVSTKQSFCIHPRTWDGLSAARQQAIDGTETFDSNGKNWDAYDVGAKAEEKVADAKQQSGSCGWKDSCQFTRKEKAKNNEDFKKWLSSQSTKHCIYGANFSTYGSNGKCTNVHQFPASSNAPTLKCTKANQTLCSPLLYCGKQKGSKTADSICVSRAGAVTAACATEYASRLKKDTAGKDCRNDVDLQGFENEWNAMSEKFMAVCGENAPRRKFCVECKTMASKLAELNEKAIQNACGDDAAGKVEGKQQDGKATAK